MKRKISVNSCVSWTKLFFRGSLSQELRNIEVHKIGVMKNYRLDRALDLVALVAVCCDDVEHFSGDAVLVSERDAAERMTHLLSEFSLDYLAGTVPVVFERFAYIRQERTSDEIVPLDRNPTAERFL